MATIRKHYNSWQVIIRKKGHPHIYKTFASYSLATQYAVESERAIAKGIFQDMSEANQTKLKDVLARYRDNVTVDKKGAKQESYKINKLIRNKIANYSLARITPMKIAQFRDTLKEFSKPATINKYITLISVAIRTAINEWGIYLPTNPADKIKRLKEPESCDTRLEPHEESLLFEQATRSKMYWMEAIIIVALETGARQGELFRLNADDVDLNKATALLRDTKNGSDRRIGISPKAVEALKGLPAFSVDKRFFPTHTEQFKFYWKQLQRWTGLQHINFHLLRHEWASRMFEKGWDIAEVATQGGWKDWKSLRKYTHIKAEHLAEKLAK